MGFVGSLAVFQGQGASLPAQHSATLQQALWLGELCRSSLVLAWPLTHKPSCPPRAGPFAAGLLSVLLCLGLGGPRLLEGGKASVLSFLRARWDQRGEVAVVGADAE